MTPRQRSVASSCPGTRRRSRAWSMTALSVAIALGVPSSSTGASAKSTEQNIQDSLGTGVLACNAAGQPSSSASQVTAVVTYDAKAPPWMGQTVAMGVVLGTTNTTCTQDREGMTPANAQRFRVEVVLPPGATLVTDPSSPVTCQYGPKNTPCPQPITTRPGSHGGVQLAYGDDPDGWLTIGPFAQVRLAFRVRLTRAFNGLGKHMPSTCGRHRAPCSPKKLHRFAQIVVDNDERGIEPAVHSTVSPLLPLYALRLTRIRTTGVTVAALLRGVRLRLQHLPAKARVRVRIRHRGVTIARKTARVRSAGGTAKLRLRPIASRTQAIRPGRRLRLTMTLSAPGVITQRATSWVRVR